MGDKQAFQSHNSPIEGVDEAAEGFFEREKTRAAIRRGELPPSAVGKTIEEAQGGKKPVSAEDPPKVEDPVIEDPAGGELLPDPDPEPGVETPDTETDQEPAVEPDPEPVAAEISADAMITLADGSTVALNELQRGYQRQRDYTQKTTELSDQRREFDQKLTEAAQAVEGKLQAAVNLAEQLQAHLNQNMPTQQQMDHLRQVDPGEYAARVADINQKQALIGQAAEARTRLQQEAAERVAQERAARVPAEREALAAAIPAFRGDRFDAEYESLGRYVLASDGADLRPEEWDLVDDHRYVTVLWKARQYDIATRKTEPAVRKKIGKRPRTVRSGAPAEPGETSRDEEAAALANLKKNPDSREALHDAFLAKERARSKKRRGLRRTV